MSDTPEFFLLLFYFYLKKSNFKLLKILIFKDMLKLQQTNIILKIITRDRGIAFRFEYFEDYYAKQEIECIRILTIVLRGNGEVEEMRKILILVLSKLFGTMVTKWCRYETD